MDVRRHLARLSQSLREVLSGRRPIALGKPPGAPTQALTSTASVRPSGRRASVATWMEDARRLRLSRAPANPSTSSEAPRVTPSPASRRPSTSVPVAPANPAPRLAAPEPQLAPADGATRLLAASSSVPSGAPLPPDISVDFAGGLSPETLAAIESLDTTQRRLIFLRYLVRQGVYNEGFSERVLPEQYWRSRGVQGSGGDQ